MKSNVPARLKNKIFSFKEAQGFGVSQYQLNRLIKTGLVEKIAHGQYRDTKLIHEPELDYRMAIATVGIPSAVCLLSALVHYQLTDTIPKKVWILVPQKIRRRNPRLRLLRKRDPQWKVGIIHQNGYAITNIERTIVESLLFHRFIGKNEAIGALKRALKSKATTPQKIYTMARLLKVDARIHLYLEVLSQ